LASKRLEERIEQLRHLRNAPSSPGLEPTLRKAVADRSNLVIAEAAKTIAVLHLSEMIPDLLQAFDKLFEDPVKTDPKCWAKTAIVKTLTQLDYSESRPFLRGLHHVQMEPVYKGLQEDCAPQLRANCVLALVQCADLTRLDVLRHLVDAMTEPADPVRVEAVRAIHQLGGDESVLLLRLKARLGDSSPLIIGHVFDALLDLEHDRAVPFVSEYLKSKDEELRDEAALALGSSRLTSALGVLISAWNEFPGEEFGGVLLRAVSASRLSEAIQFLLDVLRTGTVRQSAAALEALKVHEHSPEIQALIKEATASRT
jgi:HEAT repeat protein